MADAFVRYLDTKRNAYIDELRVLTGQDSGSYDKAGVDAVIGWLETRLRENRIVCLLGERDLARRGVPVTFFGEPTRMPAGPAKLAVETGAPLLPVHCWFTDDGWGFRVHPEIDVTGGIGPATQALADCFAADIAEHPADWHMLQPLWLDDLSEARLARMEAR